MAGARAVSAELRAEDGFRITRRLLESCVTARTRAVLVTTPNNPTGRVLDLAEAADIVAFAVDHDLVVITDEIYEKIVYDGREHLSIASLPGAADRTLTVNGFSKGYAMTGWRLGYLAGPEALVTPALKVHEHTVSCASSFVQRGGIAALTGPQDGVHAMAKEYEARRDLVVGALNALPGVSCALPEGAFYAFADIRATGLTSAEFAQWLLAQTGVVVAPGTAFGAAWRRVRPAVVRGVPECARACGGAYGVRTPGPAHGLSDEREQGPPRRGWPLLSFLVLLGRHPHGWARCSGS